MSATSITSKQSAVVDLEFVARLEPAVSLAEIKQSKKFGDWALVRQGRLSTMAVPENFVEWVRPRYPLAHLLSHSLVAGGA